MVRTSGAEPEREQDIESISVRLEGLVISASRARSSGSLNVQVVATSERPSPAAPPRESTPPSGTVTLKDALDDLPVDVAALAGRLQTLGGLTNLERIARAHLLGQQDATRLEGRGELQIDVPADIGRVTVYVVLRGRRGERFLTRRRCAWHAAIAPPGPHEPVSSSFPSLSEARAYLSGAGLDDTVPEVDPEVSAP